MNALVLAAPLARASSALSMRLVTDDQELRRLVPAWRELLAASAAPNPMCAPAWLLTWWDVYGRNRDLRVGVFQDGAQLVGLAPLCRRRHWYRPGIPLRRLEFLGCDVPERDGVCSDYLGLMVRPGHEERVAASFAEALRAGQFGAWDECILAAMAQDSSAAQAVAAALRQTFRVVVTTERGQAPCLRLPPTWKDFEQTLSKKRRQSLKYALRDFHAWAGDDWQLHSAETDEQRAQGLRILEDLHQQRWQAEGHGGAFAAPRFRAFHEQFTRLALADGQLLLLWLTVRGRPVASLYALAADGTVYFYQSGRILDAPAKVRLGIVMIIQTIQHAMSRGMTEFDFLAGDAQYKTLFTEVRRTLFQVRVARPGLPELGYRLARGALRWARSLRHGAGVMATSFASCFPGRREGKDVPHGAETV